MSRYSNHAALLFACALPLAAFADNDSVDRKVAACTDLVSMYVPLWRELETLVPVAGSPWEEEWRELKAGGWDYGGTAAP